MKTLKEKIENQIEDGYLFAWNNSDSGIEESLENGRVTESYYEAVEELANELYSGKDVPESFTKSEWYTKRCEDSYSIEQCHTWIYNLKEYLELE